jgi:hypothetical protein
MEVETKKEPNLADLIADASMEMSKIVHPEGAPVDNTNVFINLLKKRHYWPALQVKKFFSNKNLLLLHNTYKRYDVAGFQKLYDECRSVVLDFSAPEGNNIVVTYAHSIPERMSDSDYEIIMKDTDKCDVSFEGTVVTVYQYQGKWYFGTTGCPTIDSSRYFHPTKTHGTMFDEAIAKITNTEFPETKEASVQLRQKFAEEHLNPDNAYAFILVHHDNKHIMDYTSTLGENYAKLVHIVTRNRMSFEDDNLANQPLVHVGIIYPTSFAMPKFGLTYLRTAPNAYAIMVTTVEGKRIKVSDAAIVRREDYDLGNPNVWHNMLHVYIQNNPQYKIVDYIKEFSVAVTEPISSDGSALSPTYIIHTALCTIRDIIYRFYIATTKYFPKTRRYKIDIEQDRDLPGNIRFHLAQLRNYQITTDIDKILSEKAVYHYICHNQTMKNLRLMIKFFAEQCAEGVDTGIPARASECIRILNNLLTA